jgi:hypothetical protein
VPAIDSCYLDLYWKAAIELFENLQGCLRYCGLRLRPRPFRFRQATPLQKPVESFKRVAIVSAAVPARQTLVAPIAIIITEADTRATALLPARLAQPFIPRYQRPPAPQARRLPHVACSPPAAAASALAVLPGAPSLALHRPASAPRAAVPAVGRVTLCTPRRAPPLPRVAAAVVAERLRHRALAPRRLRLLRLVEALSVQIPRLHRRHREEAQLPFRPAAPQC